MSDNQYDEMELGESGLIPLAGGLYYDKNKDVYLDEEGNEINPPEDGEAGSGSL